MMYGHSLIITNLLIVWLQTTLIITVVFLSKWYVDIHSFNKCVRGKWNLAEIELYLPKMDMWMDNVETFMFWIVPLY